MEPRLSAEPVRTGVLLGRLQTSRCASMRGMSSARSCVNVSPVVQPRSRYVRATVAQSRARMLALCGRSMNVAWNLLQAEIISGPRDVGVTMRAVGRPHVQHLRVSIEVSLND